MMHRTLPTQLPAQIVAAVTTGLLLASLAGCSMGSIQPVSSQDAPTVHGSTVKGAVIGGQQPVSGATLQLYAAGAPASGGGYGVGAKALIPTLSTSAGYFIGGASGCVASASVICTALPTTDSNGSFTISNDYSCPSSSSLIYLVATGGNPGNANGDTNSYINMMAALGPCSSTNAAGNPSGNPNSYVYINEVTTISSVYALNQFMSAPAANVVEAIGAPGNTYGGVQSAVVGMSNAFTMVPNLVNLSTGTSPGTNAAYVVESSQINTLADILAFCINSDPTQGNSCTTLMADATPTGSTTATDTLQAAYYMIHYPYNNVAKLFGDKVASPPFVAESVQPIDWTMSVQIEPSYFSNAYSQVEPAIGEGISLAIDQYGNAWINNFGVTISYTPTGGSTIQTIVPPSVVELGPTGNLLLGPIATYTASTTGGAYSQFTTPPSTNIRSFAFAAAAGTVAVDLNNNAWVSSNRDVPTAPNGGSIAMFAGSTASNQVNGATPIGYYTGSYPDGIAIDANNNVFIASSNSGLASGQSVDEFINGSTYTYSASGYSITRPYILGGGNTKLAIDQQTNVTNSFPATAVANDGGILWGANFGACSISGSTILGSLNQFTTNDLLPTANSLLATSSGAANTSSTLCPSTGTIKAEFAASTANINGIAVDRYNNIWLSDNYVSATNGFDGMTYIQATTGTGAVDPVNGSVTYAASTPGTKATTTVSAAGASVEKPYAIAIDGNNQAWVGNIGINTLALFSSTQGTGSTPPAINFIALPRGPGSSPTNHQYGGPQYPAIDASGNVWTVNTANIGQTGLPLGLDTSRANVIAILIGAAAPVVTPIALAVKTKMIGQRP